MGIRVHKVLGYGLTDIAFDKFDIIDDRIDPEGMLGPGRWEDDRFTRKAYLSYLTKVGKPFKTWAEQVNSASYPEDNFGFDAHFERQSLTHKSLKRWSPDQSVIYQNEYGNPSVLCLIPPSMAESFSRYDDPIDYVEETRNYNQAHRVELFRDGFFPWQDLYMDSRNGKVYVGDESRLAAGFRYTMQILGEIETGRTRLREGVTLESVHKKADLIAKKLSFQNRNEADETIAPIIPRAVQYLCHFGKIFRDQNTIYQLRPMLYVYWS